jgi:hypothetical protein
VNIRTLSPDSPKVKPLLITVVPCEPHLKARAIMAKAPPNQGRPWTPERVREVKNLAAQNTPTRVIALKTGRSPEAIYGIASEKGIPLKPTNQSPYGTKKK